MRVRGSWKTRLRTVAVYSAVGAGLLPIALDLLPPTFITGARHSPPLLHGSGPLRLVGVILVDWRGLLGDVGKVDLGSVALARVSTDAGVLRSWRVHGGAQKGSIGPRAGGAEG